MGNKKNIKQKIERANLISWKNEWRIRSQRKILDNKISSKK